MIDIYLKLINLFIPNKKMDELIYYEEINKSLILIDYSFSEIKYKVMDSNVFILIDKERVPQVYLFHNNNMNEIFRFNKPYISFIAILDHIVLQARISVENDKYKSFDFEILREINIVSFLLHQTSTRSPIYLDYLSETYNISSKENKNAVNKFTFGKLKKMISYIF